MSRFAFGTIALALVGSIAAGGSAAAQGTPVASPAATLVDRQAAADYCVEQGGIVRTRVAALGTNLDQSRWVTLGSPKPFCEFTGHADAGGDSWITLSLETLYSDQPTLATLVNLTKPALPEDTATAGVCHNCCGNRAPGPARCRAAPE